MVGVSEPHHACMFIFRDFSARHLLTFICTQNCDHCGGTLVELNIDICDARLFARPEDYSFAAHCRSRLLLAIALSPC